MLREFAITIYLFVFQLIFNFFKLFPLKQKTTFVASLGHNVSYTVQELEKQTNEQVVILKTAKCQVEFSEDVNRIVLNFNSRSLVHLLRSIYHLATSRRVFVDNYYGFLAVTKFKEKVKCVQLWHAAGAIKQFGLKDLSIKNRSEKAYKRFNDVYNRFDHVIVGSDKMSTIFEEGFGLSEDRILRTGVPRTDFFYDDIKKKKVEKRLQEEFPSIKEKQVILYAPTYRDDELDSPQLMIDLDKMYKQLKYDYILFLKLHPAVNGTFENKYPGFVYNVSSYSDINELLVITDLLVTDYSSIPFEYCFLNRPMVFFAYDLDEYAEKRGFWEKYEELVPGPIVKTTDDLLEIIEKKQYDLTKIEQFSNVWNKYSIGHSSKHLIEVLYKEKDIESIHPVREHLK